MVRVVFMLFSCGLSQGDGHFHVVFMRSGSWRWSRCLLDGGGAGATPLESGSRFESR